MSLAEQRWLRLFTLCVLYVAQGIPWGFMATTLPAYLTERGLDAGFVGAVLSFTYLPYSFKWIWGPVIDAFTIPRFGRRRPWILLAQTMMVLTVVAMVALDVTTELKLLAWMIFLHTVFNSLQDVAVDALAVDLLDDDERGRANGLMYGCKYGGGLVGGYAMASVVYYTSLDTALIVQAIILIAIMMVPFFVREREAGAPPAHQPLREIVSSLGVAFSLRSSLVAVLVMLGMNFATGVLSATGYQLYVGTLGWSYTEYTALTGGWALAVGGLAAATTGFFVDRFGRKIVAATASCLMALGWVVFATLHEHWHVRELVWASGLYSQAMLGTMSVALIAMCMDLSWDKIGGSQFSAYMALSNFSVVLGNQFAVTANGIWEFYGVHYVVAAIQVAVTMLLVLVDPGELRRKLPLPEGMRPNRLGIAAVVGLVAFLVIMTIRASMKYLS